jgi:hypothetical protein
MPFVPATNVVQVTIDQIYGSQPLANVFNVQFGSPVTEVGLTDLSDTILTWLSSSYSPLMHLGWSAVGLRMRDLTTQEGLIRETTIGGMAGALSGTPLPSSIAMCVSLRTGLGGRARRGRFYVSGLTAALLETLNQNLFTAAAVSARVASITALIGDLDTAGTPWVIVSKFFNNAPRVAALVTEVETALSTDFTVDSQRGRTRS